MSKSVIVEKETKVEKLVDKGKKIEKIIEKEKKELFKLSTKDGYTFKVIVELLKYRIKNCNFILDKKGIFIKTSDSKNHYLINMKLYAKNMKYYCENQLVVGLNMTHLQKNLKPLKKKDGLSLFIEASKPKHLVINPQKADFSGSSKSRLKIIQLGIQDCDEPKDYKEEDEIPIYSKDFQKMTKEVSAGASKNINIQRRGKILRFYSEVGDLFNSETFLSDNEGQEDKEEFETSHEDYNANFQITDITQLSKISGLSTIVRINANKRLPLRITMNLGTIGKTTIYTKSKEAILQEEQEEEETTQDFYIEGENDEKEKKEEIEFEEIE